METTRLQRGVLVLDYASPQTLSVARTIRSLGVYCEIWPCNDQRVSAVIEAGEAPARAIILSGSEQSLSFEGMPKIREGLLKLGVPVLGLGFAGRLIAREFGLEPSGEGADAVSGASARMTIRRPEGIFSGFPPGSDFRGSTAVQGIKELPEGFRTQVTTDDGIITAFRHTEQPVHVMLSPLGFGTAGQGRDLLYNFAFKIAGCEADWNMRDFIDEEARAIREQVGDKRVICGLSGGVDSSVVAALLARAIPNQVTCIFVDTGLMRLHERERVEAAFRGHFDVDFRAVDASDRFLEALAGVDDPEQKRKIIGELFIRVFEEASADVEDALFLAQGTLYPDVVESVSIHGGALAVKSHHNVGGLPEDMRFELVEPLRELFKDEVRELGRELGLPDDMVKRHPFPGPGLAVRVVGAVDRERLDTLRQADHLFIEALHEEGLYDKIWQAFVVLVPVKTVGVTDDKRTYEWLCSLRAVHSNEGMRARVVDLPMSFLERISERIIRNTPRINRVVYDISSKPPATIEWE